jgi:hypothetical protein
MLTLRDILDQHSTHFDRNTIPASLESHIPDHIARCQQWPRPINIRQRYVVRNPSVFLCFKGIYVSGEPLTVFFNHTLEGEGDNRVLVATVPVNAAQHAPSDPSPVSSNHCQTCSSARLQLWSGAVALDQPQAETGCGLLGVDHFNCSLFTPIPGERKTITASFGNLTCSLTYGVSLHSPLT